MSHADALQRLGYELDGVLADTSNGGRFDDVCRGTVQRVRDELAALSTSAPQSCNMDVIVSHERHEHLLKCEALVSEKREEDIQAAFDLVMMHLGEWPAKECGDALRDLRDTALTALRSHGGTAKPQPADR